MLFHIKKALNVRQSCMHDYALRQLCVCVPCRHQCHSHLRLRLLPDWSQIHLRHDPPWCTVTNSLEPEDTLWAGAPAPDTLRPWERPSEHRQHSSVSYTASSSWQYCWGAGGGWCGGASEGMVVSDVTAFAGDDGLASAASVAAGCCCRQLRQKRALTKVVTCATQRRRRWQDEVIPDPCLLLVAANHN